MPNFLMVKDFTLTSALGGGSGNCDAATGRCALALGPLDRSTPGEMVSRAALGGYSFGVGSPFSGAGPVASLTLQTLPLAHGGTVLHIAKPIIVAGDGTATTPDSADHILFVGSPTAVTWRHAQTQLSVAPLLIGIGALGLLIMTWRVWRRVSPYLLVALVSVAVWTAPPAQAEGQTPPLGSQHTGTPINPDVNGDLFFDVVDIQLVAAAYGAMPGDDDWNPAYDLNGDGVIDDADSALIAARWRAGMHTLAESSPLAGEVTVALTRETIVHFSGALDPATVLPDTLTTSFNGVDLPGTVVVSADSDTLTRFQNPILPSSSRIRVTVDGDGLVDAEGYWVDTDGDGWPGGVVTFEYDTISLTAIAGTAVCGHVYASDLMTGEGGALVDEPLEGVTISVDGAEATLWTTTGADGAFCLDPAPLGRFFVHVDGRTAVNPVPPGAYYPFVGKPYESVAGRSLDVGNIYLPLVAPDTLQPVSPITDTLIHFPQSVIDEHPEFADVVITVPADALYADDGTRGGQVGIAPVPPNRLPGQLPPNLTFPVVITVQTDGATNFDAPAPICFPNLPLPGTGLPLPPNSQSALHSFNHDSGAWTVVGPMTVSADGLLVCTDPGVGITAPGWHGSLPGAKMDVLPEPLPPLNQCPEDLAVNPNSARYRCAAGTGLGVGGWLLTSLAQVVPCEYLEGGLLLEYACDLVDDAIDGQIAGIVNDGKRCQAFINKCLEDLLGIPIYTLQVEGNGLLYNSAAFSSVTAGWTPQMVIWLEEMEAINAQLGDDLLLHIDLGRQYRAVVGGVTRDEDLTPEQVALLQPIVAQLDTLLGGQTPYQFYVPRIERLRELNDLLRTNAQAFGSQPRGRYLLVNNVTGTLQRGKTLPGGALDDLLLAPNTSYSLYRVFPIPTGADQPIFAPELFGAYDFFKMLFDNFMSGAPGACEQLPPGSLFAEEPDEGSLGPLGVTAAQDSDGDGLSDLEEYIIGTYANDPDSDGDGINDATEFLQGSDPADGLPVSSGVVASAATQSPALDVCVANNVAAVAEGSAGVELFDVFDTGNPVLLGRIETLGSADRLACSPGRLAIADGNGGILIYNTTIPTDPVLLDDTITVGRATAITTDNLTAYVGTAAGQVIQLDLISGQMINTTYVGGAVADVGLGEMVYVLTGNKLYTLDRATLARTDTATLSGINRRLFVGDEILTLVHKSGYSTYDLADPADPTLIAYGTTGSTGWRQMALNGSGLGLAAVGATDALDTNRTLNVYDVSDPTQTNVLIDLFDTPGRVNASAIYNAQAFVADDIGGLQVVNYRLNDALGVPPTLQLVSDAPGPNVEAGQIVHLQALVTDDVQVRQVFFVVNGQTQLLDGTFPFGYTLVVPPLAGARSQALSVAAIAIDTGGNSVTSSPLMLNVVPDATPPAIARITPNNNSVERVDNVTGITAQFSEPISTTTLIGHVNLWEAGPDGLVGTGDDVAIGIGVVFRPIESLLTVQPAAPLAVGKYLIQFDAGITDRSGNPLDQAYSSVFNVRTPVFWKNPVSGNWQTGTNWSTNLVPTSNDYVVVDHTGSAFTITMSASSGNAGALEIRNPDAIVSHNSGAFTFQDDIINFGRYQIGGPTGNTTLVNGEFFNQGTFRAFPIASNSARINGRVFHNNGTANIEDVFNFNLANATFINDGVVNIAAAGQFFLAAANQTFIQSSGFITITSGGRLQNSFTPATLDLNAGHYTGSSTFNWDTIALSIGPEMTFSAATLRTRGVNSLTGDIPVGLTLWLSSNGDLVTEGDWTNNGRLLLGPSAYGGAPYSRVYINNGSLTNNGTIEDTTNEGSGGSDRAALFGDVINNGLIRAHLAMDFKQPGATLVNNGAIDVTSSGIVWFSAAGETFIQAGGYITIASGGRMHNTVSPITVDFQGGRQTGSSTFNWSNVALSIDPAMEFVGATFRTNGADNTFAGVIPAGLTLWLSSNGDLTTEGDWTNNGRLLLGPSAYGGAPYSRVYINNGALTNNGTLEDTGNEGSGDSDRAALYGHVINEGLIRANLGMKFRQPGATLVNNGTIDMVGDLREFWLDQVTLTNYGVIKGDGRLRFLSAPNNLDGTLEPGRASRAAILHVRGGMAQAPTSVTNIEIGGLTVDTQYDQVNVTDANALVDGTLNITLLNGFLPALGNTFTIVNNAGRTRSGTYDAVNGLVIDATRMFQVNYLASSVQLVVVEGNLLVNDAGDASDANPSDTLCDSDLGTPGLQCTLRAAIAYANASPGLDAIGFNLPSDALTIQPASPLPSITGPTIIDGYTQPGAAPNTLAVGNDAVLLVELDGSLAGLADGLQLTGGASTIRGLVINRFESAGIRVHSDDNQIAGNFIGTNAAGAVALGNFNYGIHVTNGSGNLIGGVDSADRNLISGNGGTVFYGIQLEADAPETVIQGNYVGTDRHGMSALGNGGEGIRILSARNTIGGAEAGAGNLVSGNGHDGIELSPFGESDENVVQGNLVGVNAAGTGAIANGFNSGINVGGDDNLIGGATPGARNIVSGNVGSGISISGSRNRVEGNYIGVDITGESALGNVIGLHVADLSNIGPAADNWIGGSAAGVGNVIAGNLYDGIELCCSELYRTIIQGNLIGVSAVTQSPLGNGWNGISVVTSETSASADILSQTVGGRGPGEANTIAYNGFAGVHVGWAANPITISGNAMFANGAPGIDLSDRAQALAQDAGGDGVTPNDPGEQTAGEPGPYYNGGGNRLRNFPVITAVEQLIGTTTITGSLNSAANATYQLEFFANAACSAHGFGEGETYLGMAEVTTDAAGDAAFVVAFPVTVPAGYLFTATSTDADGNTSEFGRCAPQLHAPAVFTVTTTADSGPGSLRQAIIDANVNHAADTIQFNIPGPGPHIISPLSPLPNIVDPVVLDAATQPGAACPTPVVELDGSQAGGFVNPDPPVAGLVITGGDSMVRGLIINRYSGAALRVKYNGGVVIECNYIGTDRTGTADLGNLGLEINRLTGVIDIFDTADNRIGGALPAQRNLISGNGTLPKKVEAIRLAGEHATGNTIAGNYIGVDVTGTAVLGNTGWGIYFASGAHDNMVGAAGGSGFDGPCAGACNLLSGNPLGGITIEESDNNIVQGNFIGADVTGSAALPNGWGITIDDGSANLIGGTDAGAGNLISGNTYYGLIIGASYFGGSEVRARDNVAQGNRIGTDRTGSTALGNGYDGVSLHQSNYNMVGGYAPGAANLIAYNGGDGIEVVYWGGTTPGGIGNAIVANAIYGNGGLGIDLGQDGVTPNDAGDTDAGANGLQNYPVLSAAATNGVTLTISGALDTISNTLMTIDIYYSLTCDLSGNGEGEVYVGSFSSVTDGSGQLVFNVELPGAAPVGAFVTAMATDADNNTSELSACVTATAAVASLADPTTVVAGPVPAGQRAAH